MLAIEGTPYGKDYRRISRYLPELWMYTL